MKVEAQKKFIDLFPPSWLNASKAEQEISLKIYEMLARKIHPNESLLAKELGHPVEDITTILEELRPLIYRDHDHIIGFAGLTTQPMTHAMKIDGITTFAWCALDALFIPELLGKQAIIHSTDPVTKKAVNLSVNVNSIRTEQDNLTVSLIDPDAEKLTEDVVGNFCHFVHFFESWESGNQWVANQANTRLVSLKDALAIAHLINRTRYTAFYRIPT